MSGATDEGESPRPPEHARGRIPFLIPLTTGMNAIGALVVLAMVAIVNIDVFGRWLANSPLDGTLELTEMGVVAVVYLTVAHAIAGGRLTRSDALLGLLERRGHLRVSVTLRLIFNLVGAVVFLLIAWGQLPRLIDAWSRGYFKGNVGIFTAPTWPLEAIMLIGSLAAAMQFLVLSWRRAQDLKRKSS